MAHQPLWKLPEPVLFHVLKFVAPPTHRASVICHQLALLSHEAEEVLLRQEESALWDIILRQDYGVQDPNVGANKSDTTTTRRSCKRLRQSIFQRVQSAHRKWKTIRMCFSA